MPPKKEATTATGGGVDLQAALELQSIIAKGLEATCSSHAAMIELLTHELRASRADLATSLHERNDYEQWAVRELQSKEAHALGSRARLRAQEEASAAALAAQAAEAASHLSAVEASARKTIVALRDELKAANHELKLNADFIATRLEYEQQIASLKAQLLDVEAAHMERVSSLEHAHAVERREASLQQEAGLIELKRLARTEAAAHMELSHRMALESNASMAVELHDGGGELKLLAAKQAALTASKAIVDRELSLSRSAEAQWAVRSSRLATQAKELGARVEEAEATVARVQSDTQAQLAAAAAALAAEAASFASTVGKLRELVGLKNAELVAVKKLASLVLQQRSEAEQLLVDALADAKAEAATRRAAAVAARATRMSVGETVSEGLAPSPVTLRGHPGRHYAAAAREDVNFGRVVGVVVSPQADGGGLLFARGGSLSISDVMSATAASPAAAASVAASPRASAPVPAPRLTYRDLQPEEREAVLSALLYKLTNPGSTIEDARRARRTGSPSPPRESPPPKEGSSAMLASLFVAERGTVSN